VEGGKDQGRERIRGGAMGKGDWAAGTGEEGGMALWLLGDRRPWI